MKNSPRFLIPVGAAAFGVFLLVIVVAIATSGARAFDYAALRVFRSTDDASKIAGPEWFGRLMDEVTTLGGAPLLTLLTILLAGYLLVRKRWAGAGFVILAIGGQSLVVEALKELFDRPRPDVVPRLVEVSSRSFPSGHAASAASVYLLLAAMLAPSLPNRAARLYVFAAAILLALLVGMSRVVLGVHYPTDVLAGWSFGLAWTALLMAAARRWTRGLA